MSNSAIRIERTRHLRLRFEGFKQANFYRQRKLIGNIKNDLIVLREPIRYWFIIIGLFSR